MTQQLHASPLGTMATFSCGENTASERNRLNVAVLHARTVMI
jgi:hypothetical protein